MSASGQGFEDPHGQVEAEQIELHGNRVSFLRAGDGPPLLLLHGIAGSCETWAPLIPALADDFTVIAPDMLGHGSSAKPRGDYSLGAYAAGARDLLLALGHESATVVGHSLGGGVAMQFAYQFPERTERLVLVASGGAGRGVSPLLRVASLPGAALGLAALHAPGAGLGLTLATRLLSRFDRGLAVDARDLRRVVHALPDARSRAAFIRTLRAVVDWQGQVVTMLDRCYLARGLPTLLVWGARDSVLPVGHGRRAHAAMPGSRLEVFDEAGHFPFHTDPRRFVALVEEFCATTEAAHWSVDEWRALLRAGRPGVVGPAESPADQADLQAASERSAT